MAAFAKFMQGRTGIDSFGRFLLFVWLILALMNRFWFHSVAVGIAALLLGVLFLLRFFSRNSVRRNRENAFYYEKKQGLKQGIRKLFVRIRDRKKYRFFKCPSCKADIRMPRRVGTFEVRCRRCGHTFKKSFKK